MNNSTFPDSREVIEKAFQHKKKLIGFPLLVIAMAIFVLVFAPRSYRSEAKLFFQVGRESVGLDPTATTGATINYMQSGRDEEIKSSLDIFNSGTVIGRAVDSLTPEFVLGESLGRNKSSSNPILGMVKTQVSNFTNMFKSLDPISLREEAIIDIRERLSIAAERNSSVIVLKFKAKDPILAQRTLEELIEIYQQEHLRIHRNTDSVEFFEKQSQSLCDQLDLSITAISDFKNEHGIGSVNDRRQTIEAHLRVVELDAMHSTQEISALKSRCDELSRQLGLTTDRIVSTKRDVPNLGADALRTRLYDLELKRNELASKFSDSHPQVSGVRQQIEQARQTVSEQDRSRKETSDDINPVHQQLSLQLKQLQSELVGSKSKLEESTEQLAVLNEELRGINGLEVKIDALERESRLKRDKFFKYSQSLEEARITAKLGDQRISNVSVVEAPSLAELPISPSKGLIGLGALLLATCGTLSLVVLSEKMNTRLRSVRDCENVLGIPVLGSIPESKDIAKILVRA